MGLLRNGASGKWMVQTATWISMWKEISPRLSRTPTYAPWNCMGLHAVRTWVILWSVWIITSSKDLLFCILTQFSNFAGIFSIHTNFSKCKPIHRFLFWDRFSFDCTTSAQVQYFQTFCLRKSDSCTFLKKNYYFVLGLAVLIFFPIFQGKMFLSVEVVLRILLA